MKRFFMLVAIVATACLTAANVYAMGELVQVAASVPAILPAALVAGAFALADPLMARPRAVSAAPRADASDPKKMLADLTKAFEDFKAANDEKLKAKTDDVVVNEKVERINSAVGDLQTNFQKAIDDLNAKLAAADIGSGVIGDIPADPEYVDAFKAHMRKGDVKSAMTKGVAEDGG